MGLSKKEMAMMASGQFADLPALERKFDALFPDGEFDADVLMRAAGVWSSGERQAALFIVNVWNPTYGRRKRWRFDLVEAVAKLDDENRAAIIAWIKNPRWP